MPTISNICKGQHPKPEMYDTQFTVMLSEIVLDTRQASRIILPGLKSLHQTREEREMGSRDMKLMICKYKN